MFRLSFFSASVAIAMLTSATFANDFAFDVPGLVGHYAVMHSVRDFQLDLGMPFANIDEVSLRLVGYHQSVVRKGSEHQSASKNFNSAAESYSSGPS
jgi:hypothetical protein